MLLSSVQPEVDTPLTATLDDPDGSISDVAWLWEISPDRTTWDAINGVTSDSYTPVGEDVDSYLRITVTYTDGHGSGKRVEAVSDHVVHEPHPDNHGPEFPSSEIRV